VDYRQLATLSEARMMAEAARSEIADLRARLEAVEARMTALESRPVPRGPGRPRKAR
jgi:BMFP domain-containing protein YqiC